MSQRVDGGAGWQLVRRKTAAAVSWLLVGGGLDYLRRPKVELEGGIGWLEARRLLRRVV